ncbi:MAG: IMP dehydrogenase [Pseudomonadota bacterium]|nr:IMP dehydrogenase [Pseudomonadota bacterium]MED5275058.1 IMP dehydrogenase [Pseudomonadota bacterium]MED5430620.1 IMP dehydrogenase [Pseudomonadota bacterium]
MGTSKNNKSKNPNPVETGLAFDDVLLVPQYSEILPSDVNLTTKLTSKIQLKIPILSAAMDTVTEAKMAISLASEGGIGIIHKNMSIDEQAHQIKVVKKYESGVIKDPITADPTMSVKEIYDITKKYGISGVPIVDKNILVGIVTNRDLRFVDNLSLSVTKIMTPKTKLVTVRENYTKEEVISALRKNRIEKILIVNKKHELKGMITFKDIQKSTTFPNASKDKTGSLIVGGAIGTNNESMDRAEALINQNADVLVIDTAHGHSKLVMSMLKKIKKRFPKQQVIAGNIATQEAAKDLIACGADAIKVGIGPGSICTTRIVAGVGVPQLSAIVDVARVAKKMKIPLIADGGIRYSGDIAKAIAAGADTVMLGGLLAGTDEAPGDVELYEGRTYKSYRGMGSIGAMQKGSRDRYFQDREKSTSKLIPEGIEGRVPYKGTMKTILHQLTGGLKSSMGYVGCSNIDKMKKNTRFIKISSSAKQESHVHDVAIVKEPPNYQPR